MLTLAADVFRPFPKTAPVHKISDFRRIDTTGYTHVKRKTHHKDHTKTEVWVSKNGKSWSMLGIE